MSIDTINRDVWSLDTAYRYIASICRARHEAVTGQKVELEVKKVLFLPAIAGTTLWDRINLDAARQLWQALRQGSLHAQGRLSQHRNPAYPAADTRQWIFHTSHLVWIPPEHWISGELRNFDEDLPERLELIDGEYIYLQVPRFMVEAIWTLPPPKQVEPSDYTTPYLELIKAAIAEFQITESDQSKKECLVDWFKEQQVEGEPVSDNLAKAMATIMRLPASQRGGGKRSF